MPQRPSRPAEMIWNVCGLDHWMFVVALAGSASPTVYGFGGDDVATRVPPLMAKLT